MSLSSLIVDLATRIGQEIKAVRQQMTTALAGKVDTTDARLSDARTPTAHTHLGTDLSSTVPTNRLPGASPSSYGILLLAGDLAGTAAEPRVNAVSARVSNPIRAGSVSTSITSDASSGGNLINLEATGNATINALTNPTDFQTVRHHIVASGGDRQVTFAGGYVAAANLAGGLGPYTVPRGKVLSTVSEYVANRNTGADADAPAWVLCSAYITG